MNVVFVSPNFPPTFYQFCTSLHAAGANVLGLGDAPYDALRAELRNALTEYYQVESMMDYDAMLRACGYFTHRYGKIDRLESHTEFWLGADAKLREDFNIPGQKPSDLDTNRHKLSMKRCFKESGIPCAEGVSTENSEAVRNFIAQYGFPVIFKPDQGVGAAGTFKVTNHCDLEPVLAQLPKSYLVETCLSGDLLSFDGLTNRDGDVVFWTAHHFSDGIMEIVSQRKPMHYYSLREIPARLEELGRKAVKAFEIRERFFHIEFFRKDSATYHALEVNVRPPGGFTVDMMNYACDIDLFSWWADLVVCGRKDFTFDRKYHVAHAARRHSTPYKLSHDELLQHLGSLVIAHREVPDALSDAMGNYTYFLRSPDLEELLQAIRAVEETA
ncbi:MAG: ATP-grasp domain-containing protein [Syntrophobacteraceae bacterium]